MESFIEFKNQRVYYHTIGNGSKAMLAFHGFGQVGKDFEAFESSLSEQFTIYSFDLFHHGQTSYDGKPITKTELKNWIENFLTEKGIDKFSVIAFSLGGRVAFTLMELFEGRVEYAFLLAPDGMKINPAYRFVASTHLGAWCYSLVVNYPGLFLAPLKLAKNLGIIEEKLYQFFINQMRTREKREKVFKVWVTFREIIPNLKNIQRIVNEGKVNFNLILGKKDLVIRVAFSKNLMSGITDKNSLHVIKSGHYMFTPDIGLYIKKLVK